ncbi:MAG: hypothetical protein K0R50_1944 [Eubacterium sp.]|jgi:hypothetical protein|nr:hypothetical protein [Eubacterium sp.]
MEMRVKLQQLMSIRYITIKVLNSLNIYLNKKAPYGAF